MPMLRYLWPRTVLMRVLLGALVLLGFATGCASLEEKERELTFRVVKGDAGWYSGLPDAARRFIYGHSLGGAIAIDLAAKLAPNERATGTKGSQARGLIVESSFTSLPDVAAELSYSWLPTSLILSQRFDSIDKIKAVD